MKRSVVLGLVLVLGCGVVYAVLNRGDGAAGTAPALAGSPASATQRERGAYLTKAADCIACHTVADSGKPFAGGVAFKLPIGTIYSSNITPDPTFGIGGWSDAEFVRAVQHGVGKHGEHLYPVFPYTSYTGLSRDDVLAIKAYLMSVPAVRQANHANVLGFPFNQRWALGFWNAAFFKDRRFSNDAAKSGDWNRGAYLATALGHCGECHTPRNFGFAVRQGQALAGAQLQGWRAYNITSDRVYGIGAWSDADLAHYLRTGFATGHASAGGPMGEAVAHSLQYLDPSDIAALVNYLRSVPAQRSPQPVDVESAPPPRLAGDTQHALGLALFEGACASCHAGDGSGRESPYAGLSSTRTVSDVSGANVTAIILQGAALVINGHDVYMPAFGRAYSNTEIAALANYVILEFGGKHGRVTPDDVASLR